MVSFSLVGEQFGNGDGEFNMPWGIAVDELGDVYVVDWRNDRVQKFGGGWEFPLRIGSSGDGNGQFSPAGGGLPSMAMVRFTWRTAATIEFNNLTRKATTLRGCR